jgi:hypothetical protein
VDAAKVIISAPQSDPASTTATVEVPTTQPQRGNVNKKTSVRTRRETFNDLREEGTLHSINHNVDRADVIFEPLRGWLTVMRPEEDQGAVPAEMIICADLKFNVEVDGAPLTPTAATASAAKRFLKNSIVKSDERQVVEEQGMCGTTEGFLIPTLEPFIRMQPARKMGCMRVPLMAELSSPIPNIL